MCLSNFVANQKSKFDFVRNLISRLFESFCSIVGCFLVKMSFEGLGPFNRNTLPGWN